MARYISSLYQIQKQEQGLLDKLMNNAAFGPMWGSNPRMDGMRSNQKRNGTEGIWGDSGV